MNLTTYVKVLRKYTKFLKIKIENSSIDGHGAWVSEERLIRIDFKQPKDIIVSAWLHELGHALDEYTTKPSTLKKMASAYTAVYKQRHTIQQSKIVIESEIRAWCYGEKIAEVLGLKLGRWFFKQKEVCVKNYEDHISIRGT